MLTMKDKKIIREQNEIATEIIKENIEHHPFCHPLLHSVFEENLQDYNISHFHGKGYVSPSQHSWVSNDWHWEKWLNICSSKV